ncbi:MAG: hypothetical protein QY332_10625 [Anaerolineales bacterium]|nr:MAG: hypothetical protein QY332_10625 [Anaerolineales bacterium]
MTNTIQLNDATRAALLENLPICIGFSPEDILACLEKIDPDMNDIEAQELAEAITENVIAYLSELDLTTAVKDALAQCSGMDRDKWDAAASLDNEDLLRDMSEARHG